MFRGAILLLALANPGDANAFARANPHFFADRAKPGTSLHSMAQNQSKTVSLIQQRAIARKRQRASLDAQPTGDVLNAWQAEAWAASHR